MNTKYIFFSSEDTSKAANIISDIFKEIMENPEELKSLIGEDDKDIKELVKNANEIGGSNVSEIINQTVEAAAEVIAESNYRKFYSLYKRQNKYYAGGILGFMKEMWDTAKVKTVAGGIFGLIFNGIGQAYEIVKNADVMEKMVQKFGHIILSGEVVLDMVKGASSLGIYVLVKKEIIDPLKFKKIWPEIKKELESYKVEDGCLQVENVEELSKKLTAFMVSEKGPVTKIVGKLKDMLSDKAKKEIKDIEDDKKVIEYIEKHMEE